MRMLLLLVNSGQHTKTWTNKKNRLTFFLSISKFKHTLLVLFYVKSRKNVLSSIQFVKVILNHFLRDDPIRQQEKKPETVKVKC